MSYQTKNIYLPPVLSPDDCYLFRALDLGWLAAGCTSPNPLVGAVVVNEGEVVGEGYHRQCGGPHAEVVALERAGDRAKGGTLYVSLEPCIHHGRTPPCVDRIIQAGITRVVVPLLDPDAKVCGGGVALLRSNGIVVDLGGWEDAALVSNLGYYKQRLGLGQSVTLKAAVTLDGKIASGPGRRDDITGVESRRDVHRLRSNHDCVIVGIDTYLCDNPILDNRLVDSGCSPVPVVLDGNLRFPAQCDWASQQRPFYVMTGRGRDPQKIKDIEAGGGRVIECGRTAEGVSVPEVLDALFSAGMERVLVEGGAKVFSSFVSSGRWDALYVYQSPKVFGRNGVPLFDCEGQLPLEVTAAGIRPFEQDVLRRYLNTLSRNEIITDLDARARRNE